MIDVTRGSHFIANILKVILYIFNNFFNYSIFVDFFINLYLIFNIEKSNTIFFFRKI